MIDHSNIGNDTYHAVYCRFCELHFSSETMHPAVCAICSAPLHDDGSDDNIRRKIEQEFAAAGWRACIDHLIKPQDPCPVCRIEALSAEIKELKRIRDDKQT